MTTQALNPHAPDAPFADSGLLKALMPADLELLKPHLQDWRAASGAVIYEPGDIVQHAYLPRQAALVSFMVMLADGTAIETIMVGREGAVGGIVSNGRLPAYARAVVQFGGGFYRIETAALEAAKMRSITLRHVFARYADCLLAQVFQSIACNAAHSIEQRTAKWMISAMEHTGADELLLTQEHIAQMLGVGRSYVSRVIQRLKHRNIVETRRGLLRVKDRPGLHALACHCNDMVDRHFQEVMSGAYPGQA